MRSTLAAISLCAIPLAACGGKSRPPPPPVEEEKVVAEPEPPATEQPDEPVAVEEEEYVPPPPAPPNMVGSWTTGCIPSPDGKGAATIDATLTADAWDVTVRGASDAACTKPAFTMHMTGTYSFGEMSTTAGNAWAIDFVAASHELTAANKTSAKAFGKACGIKKMKAGKAYDIHAKGCKAVQVMAAGTCDTEYQLAQQVGNRILFGSGPDLCAPERRPTAIDATFGFRYVWAPTGITECDQMLTKMDGYSTCDKMPAETRTQVFEAMRMSFASFNPATLPPDAVQAMTEGCKQGLDGIDQGMAAMGCTAP